jgi:exopolysaccharide biosynthesis WecB/TagA/CpsF family protein
MNRPSPPATNFTGTPTETALATASPETSPRHVEFLGLRFALLSPAEAVTTIISRCGAPYRYVVTPNAHDIVMSHDAPAVVLPVMRGAWLSLCDSRIVRALARHDGLDIPLVTGSDLVAALLAALNAPGSPARKVLVAGPQDEAVAALRAVFPNVAVEVMPAPGGLAKSPVLRSEVARACLARPWDILLLCVGGPAQQLIAREIETLGRPNGVALCVGAAIDFATGRRKRAPAWMQQRGLEWAYRLWREPARLWRRYLVESPKIFRLYIRLRRRGAPLPPAI